MFTFKKMMQRASIAVSLLIVAGVASAADAGVQNLGSIAENITGSFYQIGQLMTAIAYLAGFCFVIFGIFKFKQHKDNPTQIPLGTPMVMVTIGAVLIFVPAFVKPAGSTLLGGDPTQSAGGFTGGGAAQLPGGGTS